MSYYVDAYLIRSFRMRNKMLLSTILILIFACIYLSWVFYARYRNNHALLQRQEEIKAEQDTAFLKAYGDPNLKISNFYPYPGAIRRGQTTKLCYSVSNATKVRIEPPVEYVWPSFSRCVEVAPVKNTVYKLFAEDAAGNTKTASVEIKVQ